MDDWKGEHLIRVVPDTSHITVATMEPPPPPPKVKRINTTPTKVTLRREKIKVLHAKGMATGDIGRALKLGYHTVLKDIKRSGLVPIKRHEAK